MPLIATTRGGEGPVEIQSAFYSPHHPKLRRSLRRTVFLYLSPLRLKGGHKGTDVAMLSTSH